jgi:peptide/nickel transport system permease protein
MKRYIFRRMLLAIPTIWAVGTLVFFLSRMVPGDPTDAIIGQTALSSEDREELREELGLNDPLPQAYVQWWRDMLTGDFGTSIITHLDISEELKRRLPVSLELGLMGMFFAVFIGVPIGIIAAIKQDSLPDYVLRSLSIGFLSIPGFWLGILAIAILTFEFGWAPNFRYVPFQDDPVANLKQFALPAFIIGLGTSATIMRMTRATMLDVIRQDYVQTARSKGLKGRTVVVRHALPNSLIPVVTVIGLGMSAIIGGTVIFERIYNLPGTGVYLLDAIQRRDYPVIQAVNLVIATFVILVNLVVDISYSWLDPRIRYE